MKLDSGFWTPRTIWRLAYRATRGTGLLYFESNPEFWSWYVAARDCRNAYEV